MGLSDFILLIDKLGIVGVILALLITMVMFIGSLVDIFQFWWVMKRLAKRRERALYNRIKAQILLDQHEKGVNTKGGGV